MAPYGSNGQFYDPVGSQANQPHGYTYQQPAHSTATYASSTATNYQAPQNTQYGSTFTNQYGTGQQTANNRNVNQAAAAALSTLSSSEYDQTNRASNSRTFNDSSWSTANYRSNTNNTASSDRSFQQSYPTLPPVQQMQQHQPPQPQRYKSPLHAVQAQQRQQVSPQMTTQSVNQSGHHHQGSSGDIYQTTVDPSQVYDFRAEQQRKANIEAEKRRKIEAEQAVRKAEEDRIAAEKQKQEQAEKDAEAAKQAQKDKRAAAARERRQNKTAATALQKLATGSEIDNLPPPANAEEAEMRAMFQKMREFNAKNPAMLAKMWEEERQTHVSSSPQPSQAAAAPPPAAPPATASSPARKRQKKAALASAAPATLVSPVTQTASQVAKPPASQPAQPPKPSTAPGPTTPQTNTNQQRPPLKPMWPPQKKGEIAAAAATWLRLIPWNKGKDIRQEAIAEILETNPSYIQLCQGIEALGFKFDRAPLARQLLKIMPESISNPKERKKAMDANAVPTPGQFTPMNGASSSNPGGSTPQQGPVQYQTPAFASLTEAAKEGPIMQNAPTAPMVAPATGTPAGANQTSESPAPVIKAEEPPRPPANKEEAARKRTFGDLVDLTAGDSDDDDMPTPSASFFKPPVPSPSMQGQGPPQNNHFKQPMTYSELVKRQPNMAMATGQYVNRPPGPPMNNRPPGPPHPHPHMAPPVQRPTPPKPKGPSLETIQQQRMRGTMLVEPIMRDRVARKSRYDPRTIARDVLLATGRHPDMRALNSHLNQMEKLLGKQGGSYDTDGSKGNRSDLATIRWDIIDPAPAPKPPANQSPALEKRAEIASGDRHPNSPHVGTPSTTQVPRPSLRTDAQGFAVIDHVPAHSISVNHHEAKVTKPKGRPPGRPLVYKPRFHQDAHSSPIAASIETGEMATPAQMRNPSSASAGNTPNPITGAVGYAAFRKVDEDGNVIKTKGRPKGWKKSLHSREAQGLTPAKPSQTARASSKLRQSQPANEPQLQEPEYQVYRCEWLDCKAELHNLETLKKHVLKIHGRKNLDDVFDCLWQDCDGVDTDNPQTFTAIREWLGHVHKLHLQPIAWQLGDGPRGGMPDYHDTDASEASYLSDAYGRSVTPVILPPLSGEALAAEHEAVGDPDGRLPTDMKGLTKETKKAITELKKLEQHKLAVGLTMEQSGCILASAERREGFLDDEDFEDIIDDAQSDDEVYENYQALHGMVA